MFAKIGLQTHKFASDLLSRNFCSTKKGLEFKICCVLALESVNQLEKTKNLSPLREFSGITTDPLDCDCGELGSKWGAPPKSLSIKMAEVRGSIAFATPV